MHRFHKLWMLAFFVWIFGTSPALAHVPYFEYRDFSESFPFVADNVEQSIAVYAWLETDGIQPSTDADVYRFQISEATRVYAEVLVPVCPAYRDFLPWFLLAGPGLPPPEIALPFEIPAGDGAIIMENAVPGTERDTLYEPFGGKYYYSGPVLDLEIETPGVYTLYYWDPYQMGGDYVAVIGWKEIWKPKDIVRALYYTPQIRHDQELHTDCGAD